MRAEERASLLEEIAAQIRDCRLCRLCEGRTHAVPGEGPTQPQVMFIGEGPGMQEDRQGRPFVGPAGQLLSEMLLRAGLQRSEVYITNVVKCRPPQNREPRPDEAAACRPYLEAQIALLEAPIICLLGRPATQELLDPTAAMGKVHGRVFRREGLSFMPIYHPAAALHQPANRARLEEDFAALGVWLQSRQG